MKVLFKYKKITELIYAKEKGRKRPFKIFLSVKYESWNSHPDERYFGLYRTSKEPKLTGENNGIY
jgi:hypothetical protein